MDRQQGYSRSGQRRETVGAAATTEDLLQQQLTHAERGGSSFAAEATYNTRPTEEGRTANEFCDQRQR
jgi:hypothetical protein